MTRVKYKNPPLVEAVCEFRIRSAQKWESTIVDAVETNFKDTFPRRQDIPGVLSEVRSESSGFTQSLRQIRKTELSTDDRSHLLLISENQFAISHLKPYASWNEFRKLVRRFFNCVIEVSNPHSLERVGIRYVNHINFQSSKKIELSDFFEIFPKHGNKLPRDFSNIFLALEYPVEKGASLLRLQMASQYVNEVPRIAFDLDCFTIKSDSVKFDGVMAWLDKSHDVIEEFFEGSIKDSLRNKFDLVK